MTNTLTITVTGWRQAEILFDAAHSINKICGRVDADSTSGHVSDVLSRAMPAGILPGTRREITLRFNLSDAAIINMNEAMTVLANTRHEGRYAMNVSDVADEWWSAVVNAEMDDEGWHESTGE